MIWIIGEYAERIDNADELLESFLDGFQDENTQVGVHLCMRVRAFMVLAEYKCTCRILTECLCACVLVHDCVHDNKSTQIRFSLNILCVCRCSSSC